MAEANVQTPPTEVEGVKKCEETVTEGGISDDAFRPRLHSQSTAASSSSSSSRPDPRRRLSSRRPDGTSGELGPADLGKVLRRESIVDMIEIAHLTLPSTPLRENVDGVWNDVKSNLELASEKLSKLAPTD